MGNTVIKLDEDPEDTWFAVMSTFSEHLIYAGDDEKDLRKYLYKIDPTKKKFLKQQVGNRPEARIDRAKKNGSSDMIGSGWWNTSGFIYKQEGTISRANLKVLAERIVEAQSFKVPYKDLLEPFEDEDD